MRASRAREGIRPMPRPSSLAMTLWVVPISRASDVNGDNDEGLVGVHISIHSRDFKRSSIDEVLTWGLKTFGKDWPTG